MNVFKPIFYACCAGALWGVCLFQLRQRNNPPPSPPALTAPQRLPNPPDEQEDGAFVRGAKGVNVVPIPKVGGADMDEERQRMTIKPK